MAEGKEKEIRMILIGKVGSGKSTLGNKILGKKVFETGQSFSSVTTEWKSEFSVNNNTKYFVVDTPGVNGIEEDTTEAFKCLARCFFASSPGFHCIVLVISGTERITELDKNIIVNLDEMLGKEAHNFIIVVFTGVKPNDLERLIFTSDDIHKLCMKCRGMYLSVGDNTDKGISDKQMTEFFEKVNNLVRLNCGSWFRHPDLKDATDKLESDAKEIEKRDKIPYNEAYSQARKNALDGKSRHDEDLLRLFDNYRYINICCKIFKFKKSR